MNRRPEVNPAALQLSQRPLETDAERHGIICVAKRAQCFLQVPDLAERRADHAQS